MSDDELVARWMGWTVEPKSEFFSDTWGRPNCKTHYGPPPPYRTDPALLWELTERLFDSQEWSVYKRGRSPAWVIEKRWKQIEKDTLAEAVFAAAVVQAQAETPSEYTAEVSR